MPLVHFHRHLIAGRDLEVERDRATRPICAEERRNYVPVERGLRKIGT
jgi:hypothetical protein